MVLNLHHKRFLLYQQRYVCRHGSEWCEGKVQGGKKSRPTVVKVWNLDSGCHTPHHTKHLSPISYLREQLIRSKICKYGWCQGCNEISRCLDFAF